MKFQVELLREAKDFVDSLPQNVRRKIYTNISKVSQGVRDSELFCKLEGTDIWEFRTRLEGNAYRLFAFWDKEVGALVVATHGLIKKTQKTPLRDIRHAEDIMRDYFQKAKK